MTLLSNLVTLALMSLPSLIFIDGGNPDETKQADQLLKDHGFAGIQGQTTNPSLVAKNPDIGKYLASGKKLTREEALIEYKKIIESVAKTTSGPVSIQVIADQATDKDDMLRQANIYRDWIPNGVIKFPCTHEGLAAASDFCQSWSVNITLNFSQEQAAAVYAATKNHKQRVFVSPFVGRLDDRGENGMDVVAHELKMFQDSDHHTEVLTASIRKLDHLLDAFYLKSPAVSVPLKVLQLWADTGFAMPAEDFAYHPVSLKEIAYREISLDRDWQSYDLYHELTDTGLTKFMADWMGITK